jgi:type VI secretion system protein ImpE
VTSPEDLYRAGRLDEAIQALGAVLRSNPVDVQRRAFLFELLCFAGEYDRAEKQLDVLAGESAHAGMGALLYRSAIHAQRTRVAMFTEGTFPRMGLPPAPVAGSMNGRPFSSLQDADPRIGARLEVFAAGQYTWIAFENIASLQVSPPQRLRDLLWAPARLRTTSAAAQEDLGEVLIPVLTPLASRHPDDLVRLGRMTDWEAFEDGSEIPVGQKLLLVDGAEVPILEVRELEIAPAPVVEES